MYGKVGLSHRSLREYEPLVGGELLAELQRLAQPLEGLRVLHLSYTAFGTSVADLLGVAVPLLRDLGLDCQWQLVRSAPEFSAANQALYMALNSSEAPWSAELASTWLEYNRMNAGLLDREFDVIVVHDPQPLALPTFAARPGTRWVWHCHLDMAGTREDVWRLLRPHAERYDAVLFDAEDFGRPELAGPQVRIVAPCIDPLAPRNMELSPEAVTAILEQYGIDPDRPLVCQLSPFSDWTDPVGAIEAFSRAQREAPALQMVLAATYMVEDPASQASFERVAEKAAQGRDIRLFCTMSDMGNVAINALQRAAAVVMQRALGRGFGLWLSEALWKERPVVAGWAPGCRAQLVDGHSGYLCATVEEFAYRIASILADPALARRLGLAGREQVQRRFLITRLLADYLALFRELSPGRARS